MGTVMGREQVIDQVRYYNFAVLGQQTQTY